MKKSSKLTLLALATISSGVLLGGVAATAGQLKNMQTPIPNGGCVRAFSGPVNQKSAMALEAFEFITAEQDNYKCCVRANRTGQNLFIRLIGLTGVELRSTSTPVNGNGCTTFTTLGANFAFFCLIASGAGSPVVNNARYRLDVCRQ